MWCFSIVNSNQLSIKEKDMTIRVAINGFGRIGRNVLRALLAQENSDIELVACNDLGDPKVHAHLLEFDTTHGPLGMPVELHDSVMTVGPHRIQFLSEPQPKNLPWKDMNIDLVMECTGLFAKRDKAQWHCDAGAKKVLISAPAGNDVDATIVFGVNHHTLRASDTIVSNASCTTNCLAPIVKPLADAMGFEQGLMTTIHAVTNDQKLTDVYHSDVRRARSGTQSMIPTKTGAAQAVGLVLPEMAGKLDGVAIRVPTINVSLVDLSFVAKRETDVAEVNAVLTAAAQQAPLSSVLAINERPLVSVDFNHNPASSVADLTQTKVQGRLVKVFAWYDNEWGFANRMLDTARAMMQAS
jgi:glyceraldehyde 3-phosphate dehydrogenase